MSVIEATLDTNILFYAFDPADDRKRSVARDLLIASYRGRSQIGLQCLSEFYRAATRKKVVSQELAERILLDLRKGLRVASPVEADLPSAVELHQRTAFQFFDCLLCATMSRCGCSVLFSEDLQDGFLLGKLKVVNPFLLGEPELRKFLASLS